jgi:hypothetical protein
LREELRIKDARLANIPAHHRPFYRPSERLAILELRAVRGWSLEQTAKTFFVCPKTIASWMKRVDEEGATALVQVGRPGRLSAEMKPTGLLNVQKGNRRLNRIPAVIECATWSGRLNNVASSVDSRRIDRSFGGPCKPLRSWAIEHRG